jgi:hypothetical protein
MQAKNFSPYQILSHISSTAIARASPARLRPSGDPQFIAPIADFENTVRLIFDIATLCSQSLPQQASQKRSNHVAQAGKCVAMMNDAGGPFPRSDCGSEWKGWRGEFLAIVIANS